MVPSLAAVAVLGWGSGLRTPELGPRSLKLDPRSLRDSGLRSSSIAFWHEQQPQK